MKPDRKANKFVFKKLDQIGVADADADAEYLYDCFVETGDLDALTSIDKPHRIVLGRTGAGKTALLRMLADKRPTQVIEVKPESLAFNHVSTSTIIQTVSSLGVRFDPFFKLLWRHVLTVEVIKTRFSIRTERDRIGLWDRLKSLFNADQRHRYEQAIRYLEEWGKEFWQTTDYRVREVTSTLENNITASVHAKLGPHKLELAGGEKLTEAEKKEVVRLAQNVVSSTQVRQLSDILTLLNDVLDDPQKPIFVVIDKLDENWVDDKVRYLLIRALIETVRDFCTVRHAKIIVALRRDLIDRVIRMTRDTGFQEEKYESLYLSLSWSRKQLGEIIDRRIEKLVKNRYETAGVKFDDLVAADQIDGVAPIQFILSRTLQRPRDAILFINKCIECASERPQITRAVLQEAEGLYSRARLRALADEWIADYPDLQKSQLPY